MASENKGRPLPKFGEWDVNNPASAEGFTVIFNKARDDKKTNTTVAPPLKLSVPHRIDNNNAPKKPVETAPKERRWFCCG